MKKTIRDFELENKKVIIRCDFNVPIDNGLILDDNRIRSSLETINYAIEKGSKVILMSHLGRVKTVDDKVKNSLEPVSKRLSELLGKEVKFIKDTRGPVLEEAILKMNSGDVILVENTRYEDLDSKKESNNDLELGKYWASLGDIFINDAFGTSHRNHASNVGIASNLPSGIGFLIEKELKNIKSTIDEPKRPFAVILGGSKVSDKIGVINNLVNIADYILIGGGMSYTFLKAKGNPIGKSLLDNDSLEFCSDILSKYNEKIILPVDVVCSSEISEESISRETDINDISENEMGLDIGVKTIENFETILKKCKTVIWNGPVGVFEIDKFSNGTRKIAEILSKIDATTIIGGGDTASAVINFGYKDSFTHISTGGGATLVMLEGSSMPGIDVIKDLNYEK